MKHNFLITILFFVFFFSCANLVQARGKRVAGHFQVEAGAGAVMFPYNSNPLGSLVGGAQIGLEAKYNYLFSKNPNWGLSVGLGVVSFQGAQTVNKQLLYNTVDDEGDPYVLIADVSNWYEKQQSYAVKIPIGFLYQYKPRYSDVAFLTSLSFNVIFPLYSSYRVVVGDITTRGDYSQWGGTILEDLPQHGFTTTSNFHPDGKLNAQIQFSAEYQIGALFVFDNNTEMFVTAYMEHGVRDMFKPMPNKPLFYSLKRYNGYYGSMYGGNTVPIMFGVKIGFRLVDIHGCNCIRY